jgi:Domain of unknown function (DUF4258)
MIRSDRHARRRMKWRGISEEEALAVLAGPDETQASEFGRLNALKTIDGRRIKIVFRQDGEDILVISALVKSRGGSRED